MTIVITTTMRLVCSICGKEATYSGSKMSIIKQAREDGWHLMLDAICPGCQPPEIGGNK